MMQKRINEFRSFTIHLRAKRTHTNQQSPEWCIHTYVFMCKLPLLPLPLLLFSRNKYPYFYSLPLHFYTKFPFSVGINNFSSCSAPQCLGTFFPASSKFYRNKFASTYPSSIADIEFVRTNTTESNSLRHHFEKSAKIQFRTDWPSIYVLFAFFAKRLIVQNRRFVFPLFFNLMQLLELRLWTNIKLLLWDRCTVLVRRALRR